MVIVSLILHPFPEHEQTVEAWRYLETMVQQRLVLQLGISDVSLKQLQRLYKDVTVKPSVVRLRSGFDNDMRDWCATNGVQLQEFWSVTESTEAIESKETEDLAEKYQTTLPALLFRFLMGLGIVPVTGVSLSQGEKKGRIREQLVEWGSG